MTRGLITLTSDFGSGDPYVGAMKGVILSINPEAVLVDITHDVQPQNVLQAAFILGSIYRYFPKGTIHLVVVDPGVGTARKALLVQTPHGFFVGPDNGVLTCALGDLCHEGEGGKFLEPVVRPLPQGCQAFALTKAEFFRHPVSTTFHGRDIFAPVAAALSRGSSPQELGEPVTSITCLHIPRPRWKGAALQGHVLYTDHFGNLVTNIPGELLPQGTPIRVEIQGRQVQGLVPSYAYGRGLVALVGSHGYLEIALVNGNAAATLQVEIGAEVRVFQEG